MSRKLRGVTFMLSVFFAAVFLFNLEIIIGAVIIKDLIISLTHEMAVFINFSLDQITLCTKNI